MLKNYTKVVIDEAGDRFYLNDEDEEHRLDGPAVEFQNGEKEWRINGNNHRNIGPADEWWDGEKRWYFKNKLHRIGGLVSFYDGYCYIHSKSYSKKGYFNIVWDI